jgi:putative phage-type endonuclease
MMPSGKNAKTNDNEYCRHNTRNSDEYDDDSDATITDDEVDHDVEYRELTAPYSVLPSDEDRETIINDALDELAIIARENILEFKREDFNTEEVVGTWIDSYVCQYFAELTPARSNFSTMTSAEADALNEVLETYIQELYDEITERFYEEIVPPRVSMATTTTQQEQEQEPDTDKIEGHVDVDVDAITAKIRTLQEKPQPEQRTPEWYTRRNNLITASSASKAFGSQASVNQLVYEKCKNQPSSQSQGQNQNASGSPPAPLQGSVNSPLHWGQRYEPLTVMVYEHRNTTKLGEFGCIQHDTYPFIGASPDGINIDATSPLYGRMVEIKNIVNREITGRPKEEYWIQTQIQMEVCDLDECDFVETRFKEYDSKEEYDADATTTQGYTADENEKGVILWFQTAPALTQQGYVSPPIQLYEYAPIGASPYEYDRWEAETFMKHQRLGSIWVRTIYWYLDQYSCVLVRRNRLWFEEAVPILQQVWDTIEKERETGYEHRAPMKRKTACSASASTETTDAASASSSLKIVKLNSAIVPNSDNTNTTSGHDGNTATATATATNMAILMAMNNNMTKKTNRCLKGPSDVLINCFKIDDLEIDESKVEQ